MSTAIFFVKAILMIFLPFYRVDFPVERVPREFTYTEPSSPNLSTGALLSFSPIVKEGDPTYDKLKALLIKEKHGWKYDLNSYVSNQVFTARTMIINCSDSWLVVNYEEKEGEQGFTQISKKINGSCPSAYDGKS